jgi:pimeloyl-ACP methyl ester carboxylesterase
MERVTLNGADIEYEVRGSGEPLLLIHGSIIANAFFPLLNQPGIANAYRVISYHRRGFAGSARAQDPFTIGQQAADAHALLRHLGIPRAHVAGHSYGGAIALQLALDTPEDVHSLALLEPALLNSVPSGPTFWEGVAVVGEMYEKGDKVGTTDAFLTAVCGAAYQQLLDAFLPPGTYDLAVSDLDTFFQVEMPALRRWRVAAEDA